ncbi:MAG: CRISPR-associated endonuclease Cas2 [Calditrichaeota bacterium]|nr:CRISPR-associated endonuclease Cas2 [Calditrichota bacterium]
MLYLVCYDVNTETKEGRRRLRKVAQACKNFGQRAQKSVFEVDLTPSQYTSLVIALLKIINEEEDSLRIYHIEEPLDRNVESWGCQSLIDISKGVVL